MTMDENERQRELLAEATRLTERVNARLAWCEENPADAARRYGVDRIVRMEMRVGEFPTCSLRASLHTWTEAIAREIMSEGWRWHVNTNAYTGRPEFVVTDYLPEPPPAPCSP
jgi:hypothetical protein